MFTHGEVWENLEDLSNAEPPVFLCGNNCLYGSLFKLLAPRFLLAPDHVLDAERVHARWQWACTLCQVMKIMTLNATLRLQHYLENNQTFPLHEDLLPHLHAESMHHKLTLEAISAEQDAPLEWRSYVDTSKQPT